MPIPTGSQTIAATAPGELERVADFCRSVVPAGQRDDEDDVADARMSRQAERLAGRSEGHLGCCELCVHRGADPQAPACVSPGSRRTRPSPLRKAFGAHVIGSTARLRRAPTGSGSPVKIIR